MHIITCHSTSPTAPPDTRTRASTECCPPSSGYVPLHPFGPAPSRTYTLSPAEPTRRSRPLADAVEPAAATPVEPQAPAADTGAGRRLMQGSVPCHTNKAFPYGALGTPQSWDWRNAGVITPVRNQLGVSLRACVAAGASMHSRTHYVSNACCHCLLSRAVADGYPEFNTP